MIWWPILGCVTGVLAKFKNLAIGTGKDQCKILSRMCVYIYVLNIHYIYKENIIKIYFSHIAISSKCNKNCKL